MRSIVCEIVFLSLQVWLSVKITDSYYLGVWYMYICKFFCLNMAAEQYFRNWFIVISVLLWLPSGDEVWYNQTKLTFHVLGAMFKKNKLKNEEKTAVHSHQEIQHQMMFHILSFSLRWQFSSGYNQQQQKALYSPTCVQRMCLWSCSTMERRVNWKRVIMNIDSLFFDLHPRDLSEQMQWRAQEIIIRVVSSMRTCPGDETLRWTLFVAWGCLHQLSHFCSDHPDHLHSSPSVHTTAIFDSLSFLPISFNSYHSHCLCALFLYLPFRRYSQKFLR